jgi:hypothetical protein
MPKSMGFALWTAAGTGFRKPGSLDSSIKGNFVG